MTTIGTAVITGATSGIGLASAVSPASHVDHLVLLGPKPEHEVTATLDRLAAVDGRTSATCVCADFADLSRAWRAADQVLASTASVDLLGNNAGIPGAVERQMTADGNEKTLQVNAPAPAALTCGLLAAIPPGGRIVNVGSAAHRFASLDLNDLDRSHGYTPTSADGASKAVVIAWTLLLARRLREEDVRVIALCPGVTDTALARSMMGGPVGDAPEAAARRVVQAACATAIRQLPRKRADCESGADRRFWGHPGRRGPPRPGQDQGRPTMSLGCRPAGQPTVQPPIRRLWEVSARLTPAA